VSAAYVNRGIECKEELLVRGNFYVGASRGNFLTSDAAAAAAAAISDDFGCVSFTFITCAIVAV